MQPFSSWTALIYIFNLIVGTGSLTLPAAFYRSGWALGCVLICILSFISYVTATFVVEAMATCNALLNYSKFKQLRRIGHYLDMSQQTMRDVVDSEEEGSISATEDSPLTSPGSIQDFPTNPVCFYTIDNKVEMCEMAGMLFNQTGRVAFFLCIFLYLFGDLSIYASAIGQSLVDALCSSSNVTDPVERVCLSDYPYSTLQIYRFLLFLFLLLFGPFVFFNVQKTKYLQIATSFTRWLAFCLMISLTMCRLLDDSAEHNSPRAIVIDGFPSLLSSCVYAFMCHHSLPSLLAPVGFKSALNQSLAANYLLVLAFYLVLAVPAVFAFPKINDLFSLNFVPEPWKSQSVREADYFLILFPVFTLTASFPVISVTMRNNLQATASFGRQMRVIHSVFLPLVAVVPPVMLAIFIPNLQILVGITGSYAGVGIQYVIPATLVMVARRSRPPNLMLLDNPFASPFRSPAWPLIVLLWAVVCVSCVTVQHIGRRLNSLS